MGRKSARQARLAGHSKPAGARGCGLGPSFSADARVESAYRSQLRTHSPLPGRAPILLHCSKRHQGVKRARPRLKDTHPQPMFGEWLSLVEHLVRDQGVGGSNPLSPTILYNQQLARVSPMCEIVDSEVHPSVSCLRLFTFPRRGSRIFRVISNSRVCETELT